MRDACGRSAGSTRDWRAWFGNRRSSRCPDAKPDIHRRVCLANAVFDRRSPAPDNELLKSARDVASWLRASSLADDRQAQAIAGVADAGLVERVREIREASYAVFAARAANGLSAGSLELCKTRLDLNVVQ